MSTSAIDQGDSSDSHSAEVIECNPCVANPNLLSLPDLVRGHLVNYLNLDGLKALRETCKTTKSWVEEDSLLEKYPVCIWHTDDMRDIIRSSAKVHWNNFSFNVRVGRKAKHIVPFLEHFRPTMKILKITTDKVCSFDTETIINLLNSCGPQLKFLHLSGTFMSESEREDFRVPEWSNSNEVAKTLAGLEEVKLEFGKLNAQWTHGLSGLIVWFLQNCPNLIWISMPTGFSFSDLGTGIYDQRRGDGACTAFINALKSLGKADNRRTVQEQLNINFCSRGGRRDYLGPPHYLFPLSPNNLRELVQICARNRILLHNVPSTAFPLFSDVNSEAEKMCFAKSVVSILSINDEKGYTTRFVPPSSQIRLSFFVYSDRDFAQFQIPTDLNITAITLYSHVSVLITRDHRLYRTLFEVERPSVNELRLDGSKSRLYLTNGIRPPTFFPNLKKLHLMNEKGYLPNEMWQGLHLDELS